MSRLLDLTKIRERIAAANLTTRQLWLGDDGRWRCGRSGDMIDMLDRLKAPTIGPEIKR